MPGRHVIGVDLGGTKILAAIVDEDGRVHGTVQHETPTKSQAALLAGLEGAVRELMSPKVEAVGIGVPARVDRRTGFALGAVNIPLAEVRFQAEMEAALGLPVGGENDASAATLAEFALGA